MSTQTLAAFLKPITMSSFPLSPTNTQRVVILLCLYALAVIVSAIVYVAVSGDYSFPLHFVFLFAITAISAWGVRMRYGWAWAFAVVLAAWQIYVGVSNSFVMVKAGFHGPLGIKRLVGAAALRTIILVVLLLILVFSDRQRLTAKAAAVKSRAACFVTL